MAKPVFSSGRRAETRAGAWLWIPQKIENRSDSGQFWTDSSAIDQLLRDETLNWKERVERFRIGEWLLHEQMLEAAHEAIDQFRRHPRRTTLRDIATLCDLASKLGRRACGLSLDPPAAPKSHPPPCAPNFQAALEKAYGQTRPVEESLKHPETANAEPVKPTAK